MSFVCSYGCVVSHIPITPLTGLQIEKKNMFFVIPEMPSKTFVMVLKKNFLITLNMNSEYRGPGGLQVYYITYIQYAIVSTLPACLCLMICLC